MPKEQSEATYWGTVLEPLVRWEFALRSNIKSKLKQCILKQLLPISKINGNMIPYQKNIYFR